MDFSLSKKHLLAQSLYRSFAEDEVKPLAQEVDEREEFPRETVKKMAKCGFMGIPVQMCIRDRYRAARGKTMGALCRTGPEVSWAAVL